MSIDKYKITKLTNIKPIDISKIQTNEKDCGIVMNYHQTIITQIVEAQEKREFECICAEIQKFIEENNIDICFAINKNELIDCLQEHQIAKLKISDLEAKLAEKDKQILELQEDSIRSNQIYNKELAEKDKDIEEVKQKQINYYKFGENCKKVTIKTIDGKSFDVYNDAYEDKISFAVEQLEKVKEKIEKRLNAISQVKYTRDFIQCYGKFSSDIEDFIDNQIKELKEQL